MQTRALPGTDLSVSIIGFGGWAMGRTYWGDDVDDADSIAAVRLALDLGVNWFDTAPLYGEGHADEVLARALGNERHRDDIIIATKVGVRIRGQHGHAQCDLSPGHIRADVDASLTRLGVERIDLLQVHWPCELGTPLEESFGALDALRRSGKVRHLGVCNYDAASLARIRDIAPIVSLQTPLSLLRREYEGELAPACARLGLGVLAYEPLCRGLLTGKYLRPHSFPASDMRSRDDRFSGSRFAHAVRLVRDLNRAASRLKIPTAAIALGWAASRPGVTSAIAGMKRPEQVRDNAQAARLIGRDRIWRVIDGIAAQHGGWPAPRDP